MGNRLKTISIIIFLFIGQFAFSQRPLEEGNQQLENKTVNFEKKLSCKVTPRVVYHSDNNGYLEIYFSAEWYKKDEKIDDEVNRLFLIDNYVKLGEYYDNEGISYEYKPAAINVKKSVYKGIVINYKGKKFRHKSFKKGYVGCKKETESPIIIENLSTPKALLEISFSFVHVRAEGYDRDINDISRNVVSWTMKLPNNTDYTISCDDKKSEFELLIDELTLRHDLDVAKEIKEKIENDKKLEDCPDIKAALLEKIDNYIEQEEPIAGKTKDKPKDKPKEVKKKKKPKAPAKQSIDWAKREKYFTGLIAKFNKDYNWLKRKIENKISDINESVYYNNQEISLLESRFKSSEILPNDTLELIKIKYGSINTLNEENKNEIDIVLSDLRNFKKEIKKGKYRLTKDYNKVDDKARAKNKYDKFNKEFNNLIGKVTDTENVAENVQQEIDKNNNLVLNLLEFFDKESATIIRSIKTKYDSLFATFINDILKLEEEYHAISAEFEDNRYSKSYFKAKKKKFIGRTDKIYRQIVLLQTKDSLTIIEKNTELAQHEFNINFNSEQDFKKTLLALKPDVKFLNDEIKEWPANSFPYMYLVLFILMAAILGFGGRVYLKALKAKNKKAKQPKSVITPVAEKTNDKPSGGGITITHSESNKIKGKDLIDVRRKAGKDYLELDMADEWDDTAVSKVYFHKDCIIKTYRFFEDSIHAVDTETTANETGGYLIGRWDFNKDNPDKYDVSLEDFIEPGDDATFSRYQLNFGAKIAVKLQNSLENCRQKENLDFVMTAWFHSHPGLKIFLSDFDLTVQEDFSRKENKLRMVALVIDPYTDNWDTGIFTYQAGGEMNNASDSKQFFSLETMYQWAIGPGETINHDNYFSENIKKLYPNSITNNVYFSNPCILEMKRHIEDANSRQSLNGISSFIGGKLVLNNYGSNDIVFENLISIADKETKVESKSSKITGCVITTSGNNPDISQLLAKPEITDNKIPLIVIYNFEDKTIILLSKNQDKSFNKIPEVGGRISFADMVTWTRKRK
ncbi:MAG: hypothetical protein DRJ05_00920 [Bacteroidetes bacterium]|nr:MAG: hypothetical protein DRJ05_00920 [Bacteroidota bacterium]